MYHISCLLPASSKAILKLDCETQCAILTRLLGVVGLHLCAIVSTRKLIHVTHSNSQTQARLEPFSQAE